MYILQIISFIRIYSSFLLSLFHQERPLSLSIPGYGGKYLLIALGLFESDVLLSVFQYTFSEYLLLLTSYFLAFCLEISGCFTSTFCLVFLSLFSPFLIILKPSFLRSSLILSPDSSSFISRTLSKGSRCFILHLFLLTLPSTNTCLLSIFFITTAI